MINFLDMMVFPRVGSKNPDVMHDLSLFEVVAHGIDVGKLLRSGLWMIAPNQDWLIRTERGRQAWWEWAIREGIA